MSVTVTVKNKTMGDQAYCEAKDWLCIIMSYLEPKPIEHKPVEPLKNARSNALNKGVKLKK